MLVSQVDVYLVTRIIILTQGQLVEVLGNPGPNALETRSCSTIEAPSVFSEIRYILYSQSKIVRYVCSFSGKKGAFASVVCSPLEGHTAGTSGKVGRHPEEMDKGPC